MKFSEEEIKNWEKGYRIKFINSITGYKSIHLIGTNDDDDGVSNIGLFSNVFHISSSPALIGIAFRPKTVFRNTLENLKKIIILQLI